ncbi:uncharacterized protein CPUR_02215 [Claviceps purpurea 20.1]|uniref:Uncharacterized protein n=1 Tax=Claviceps purpurea (strain 20.1) TaxID=1111077 RepID=M1W7M8_CLAP2|nr:uncharacterized protein CPUR_02215 [Claviceps purpurea 20.1]
MHMSPSLSADLPQHPGSHEARACQFPGAGSREGGGGELQWMSTRLENPEASVITNELIPKILCMYNNGQQERGTKDAESHVAGDARLVIRFSPTTSPTKQSCPPHV